MPTAIYGMDGSSLTSSTVDSESGPAARGARRLKLSPSCLIGITLYLAERIHRKQATWFCICYHPMDTKLGSFSGIRSAGCH